MSLCVSCLVVQAAALRQRGVGRGEARGGPGGARQPRVHERRPPQHVVHEETLHVTHYTPFYTILHGYPTA